MTGEAFALKPEDPEAPDDDKFGAKLESVDSRKNNEPPPAALKSGVEWNAINRQFNPQERMVAI